MGAIRIFRRFRELLDVDWANIGDGDYLKRNGSLIDGGTPGGGSGPVSVTAGTVTAQAGKDWDGILDSTTSRVLIVIRNLVVSTDASDVTIGFRSGTPADLTDNVRYHIRTYRLDVNQLSTYFSATSTEALIADNMGNDTGEKGDYELTLPGNVTGDHPLWVCGWLTNNGNQQFHVRGGMLMESPSAAVTGVFLNVSAGTISFDWEVHNFAKS